MTGGTGTIGSAILRRLLAEGKTVAALARSSASARWLADAGATPVAGDLANPDQWIATAMACRGIIHAGATFGPDMAGEERRLVALLRRVAAEVAEPPRLVYTGGVWAFPASPARPLSESAAFDPLPAFSHLGELVRSLQTLPRMGVAIIHPALVSAPGRGPLAEMAEAAVSGTPFVTRASADTIWPLVDADDLADLYLRALASSQFRLSLIGAGVAGARVGDIAACVAAASGAEVVLATAPAPDIEPRHDTAAGYARSQIVSATRAMRMLGWQPVCTSLETLVEVAVGPLPAAPRRRGDTPADTARPDMAGAVGAAGIDAGSAPDAETEAEAALAGAPAQPEPETENAAETGPETGLAPQPEPPLPTAEDLGAEDLPGDDWPGDDWSGDDLVGMDLAEDELPPLPRKARAVAADVEAGGPFVIDVEPGQPLPPAGDMPDAESPEDASPEPDTAAGTAAGTDEGTEATPGTMSADDDAQAGIRDLDRELDPEAIAEAGDERVRPLDPDLADPAGTGPETKP
ncbi:NAD-dependent epimerase/dehydratase family protein [Microvirga tunisiensis]|uniref:NAD-dependent epimerase/dehydratase family protein n=1 Tax=Pannonibacter tanglangensis TaxID=2750084 RepID=A0A7X5J8L7_9HYPH|nr:NAD-dependent epimerase/dehydratase family protein [Pannonibacter sp. XCT-53]NBN77385.1 NAD-dependent epimerase/dehydratase family protein [Pannonibacter sp. XCT-53]